MSGVKSLQERLKNVEEKIGCQTVPSEFADVILTDMKTKELNKMKESLNKQVTKVVEYTVRWIETNITKVASLLNAPITSELKHSTALTLIKEVVHAYTDDILEAMIRHFVALLFPSEKAKEKPKMSRKDSVRKSIKFLMKDYGVKK